MLHKGHSLGRRPTCCLESESSSSRGASWGRKVPTLASGGASPEMNSGRNQLQEEEGEAQDRHPVGEEEVVQEGDHMKAQVVEVEVGWGFVQPETQPSSCVYHLAPHIPALLRISSAERQMQRGDSSQGGKAQLREAWCFQREQHHDSKPVMMNAHER